MAGNAEQAGSSLKRSSPGVGTPGLRGNEINFGEEIVMANNSTNVIPFNFGRQEVRTLLIEDQPWFVATDVAEALQYRDSFNMCRNLDDDEKGTQIVSTLGGAQEMLAINESGLYSAILRSRKEEAKRFKKWVTAEVLPAIRKHGRYEDHHTQMPTLMDELIGMSELSVIRGLIRDKGKAVAADRQKSFALTMHNRLHTRFNVPRTELIPAGQFEVACNFIASYAIEGEYLAYEKANTPLAIHFPLEALTQRRPQMLQPRGNDQAWLDVAMHDLCSRPQDLSLCEKILCELRNNGYEIDGAWYEVRSLRNRLQELNSLLIGLGRALQEPNRFVIEGVTGRAVA